MSQRLCVWHSQCKYACRVYVLAVLVWRTHLSERGTEHGVIIARQVAVPGNTARRPSKLTKVVTEALQGDAGAGEGRSSGESPSPASTSPGRDPQTLLARKHRRLVEAPSGSPGQSTSLPSFQPPAQPGVIVVIPSQLVHTVFSLATCTNCVFTGPWPRKSHTLLTPSTRHFNGNEKKNNNSTFLNVLTALIYHQDDPS